MTNAERITYLENKIQELEFKFEQFKQETNIEIENVNKKYCSLEQELQDLKTELQSIKSDTNKILTVNEQQNNMLSKLLEKSFDANLSNISFFQKFSKKQLAIIGGIITFLIVIIKVLLGIPL